MSKWEVSKIYINVVTSMLRYWKGRITKSMIVSEITEKVKGQMKREEINGSYQKKHNLGQNKV